MSEATAVDIDARQTIMDGQAVLGIELGSTRIKASLIGLDFVPIALGSHTWVNRLADGRWTYPVEDIWSGLRACYADLTVDIARRWGVQATRYRAIGVSAMMHGYLAFDEADELLVPFRTWRNNSTGPASTELTDALGFNVPLRWSVAHLYQAVLDDEPHVPEIASLTTLAGYVHWRLTGCRVLGVGDASGMFPIDPATGDYDRGMLAMADELMAQHAPTLSIAGLLPEVLAAGQQAGELTAEGAQLLDASGVLQPGVPFCPPEGDAATGMVATNSVAPRTGNVSVGTSVFSMVVLEDGLRSVHPEVDVVSTPAGDPVAMVHCNNGASELAAWAEMFERFAAIIGSPIDSDAVFAALLNEAMAAEADAGGLLAYNYLSGEPVAGVAAGRPLFARTPDSRLTLSNFIRAQIYAVFSTLSLGMAALSAEGVRVDRMFAHGGLFRTAGVTQRMLAAAIGVPIGVERSAGEGGAWGIALLAAYLMAASDQTLSEFLSAQVFRGAAPSVVEPDEETVAGFAVFLERYRRGLTLQRAAVDAMPTEQTMNARH